jgi:putative FmdB family regulatory protein
MATYAFNCSSHGEFEENVQWEDYKAKDSKWECPECGEACERVWAGKAPMCRVGNPETHAVKRNYSYIQGSEENWMRDEVRNIKDNVLPNQKTPYSTFQITDPEAVGFRKVSDTEARSRMEAAKKSKKDTLNKGTQQKKDNS